MLNLGFNYITYTFEQEAVVIDPNSYVGSSALGSYIKANASSINKVSFDEQSPTGVIMLAADDYPDLSYDGDGSVSGCIVDGVLHVYPKNKGFKLKFRSMSALFASNKYITEIDFSNVDTSECTTMVNLFNNASVLEKITNVNFDTSKVTSMEGMFKDTKAMGELDLSWLDMSSNTTMKDMFYNSAVTDIKFPIEPHSENVTTTENSFKQCRGLTELDVSNFNFSGVTTASDMMSNMDNVTMIRFGNHASFENCTNMSSLFRECGKLTNIDGISNIHPIKAKTMIGIFQNCKSLSEFSEQPNWYCPEIVNLSGAFIGTKLKTLSGIFAEAQTPNLDYIGSMCTGMTELETFSLPFQNVTKLDSISDLFNGCTNLTSINPSFIGSNPATITSVDKAFRNCKNLPQEQIENFFSRLQFDATYFNEVFAGCEQITKIDSTSIISALFSTTKGSFKSFKQAFENCINLQSVNMSLIFKDIIDVGDLTNMFNGCTSLSKIMDVNTPNPITNYTGTGIFNGCPHIDVTTNINNLFYETNLSDVTISEFYIELDSEKFRDYIAGLSNEATQISFDGSREAIDASRELGVMVTPLEVSTTDYDTYSGSIFGYMIDDNVTLIVPSVYNAKITLPQNCTELFAQSTDDTKWYTLETDIVDFSKVKNATKMFANANITNLSEVISKANFESLNIMNNMFSGIKATSLDVSNINTSKVTNMQAVFNGAENLTDIIGIENWDTSKVTTMVNMFKECKSLKSINVSNFNTSNVTKMSGMFNYCASLTSLDVKNFDISKVDNISYMFYMCENLADIDISTWTNSSALYKMTHLFYCCRNLTSIDLSGMNIYGLDDMNNAFRDCEKLKTIVMPRGSATNLGNMSYLFANCYALTNIDWGDFYTDNLENGEAMFANCKGYINGGYIDLTGRFKCTKANLSYMFKNCAVEIITVPTQYATNLSHMFEGATIGNSINFLYDYVNDKDEEAFKATEYATDMSYMFKDVDGYTPYSTFKYLDTRSCINMSHMFENSIMPANIYLSRFNLENVVDMTSTFSGVNRLSKLQFGDTKLNENVDITNIVDNTVTVTGMSPSMKYIESSLKEQGINYDYIYEYLIGSTKLREWLISEESKEISDGIFMTVGYDVRSATGINVIKTIDITNTYDQPTKDYDNVLLSICTFAGDDDTKVVFVHPDRGTPNNTLTLTMDNRVSGLFKECTLFREISLKDSINADNVTNLSHMFESCKAENITLSKGFSKNVTDMSHMFRCTSLSNIDCINDLDYSNVTTTEYMCYWMNLKTSRGFNINIDQEVLENTESMFEHVTYSSNNNYTDNCNILIKAPGLNNTKRMFAESELYGTINLDIINCESANAIFRDAKSTNTSTINLNVGNTNLQYAFQRIEHLENLSININYDESASPSFESMFQAAKCDGNYTFISPEIKNDNVNTVSMFAQASYGTLSLGNSISLGKSAAQMFTDCGNCTIDIRNVESIKGIYSSQIITCNNGPITLIVNNEYIADMLIYREGTYKYSGDISVKYKCLTLTPKSLASQLGNLTLDNILFYNSEDDVDKNAGNLISINTLPQVDDIKVYAWYDTDNCELSIYPSEPNTQIYLNIDASETFNNLNASSISFFNLSNKYTVNCKKMFAGCNNLSYWNYGDNFTLPKIEFVYSENTDGAEYTLSSQWTNFNDMVSDTALNTIDVSKLDILGDNTYKNDSTLSWLTKFSTIKYNEDEVYEYLKKLYSNISYIKTSNGSSVATAS